MYNKNTAYDLSLFDEKAQKKNILKLNIKKIRKIRALKAKLALLISGVAICSVVSLGAAIFIRGQATLNELTAEDTRLSRKLQEVESLYIQLNMKKEAEISSDALKSRLKKDFDMVENKNIEYINVMNIDNTEVLEEPRGFDYIKNKVVDGVITCLNSK